MNIEKYFENLDDVINCHPFWKIITSLEFDPEELKAGKRIAVSGRSSIRHFRHQAAVVSIEHNKLTLLNQHFSPIIKMYFNNESGLRFAS